MNNFVSAFSFCFYLILDVKPIQLVMQMSDNSHLNLLKNHKNNDIQLSDDLESSVLRNIVCNLGGNYV